MKHGKGEVAAMAAALDPEYAEAAEAVKDATRRLKRRERDDLSEADAAELEALLDSKAPLIADIEEFATGALVAAEAIFAARASFVVVGQLAGNKDRLEIPPSDPEAIKLSLGWYSTEGDARSASESLWHSTASGDTFRTWVLPVHHGTAADIHGQRKAHYQGLEEKAREAQKERIRASIAKREAEAQVRADGGKGACECKHQQYEHMADGSSRGKCGLPECSCLKWAERKK